MADRVCHPPKEPDLLGLVEGRGEGNLGLGQPPELVVKEARGGQVDDKDEEPPGIEPAAISSLRPKKRG
jgi:hypothetical protein